MDEKPRPNTRPPTTQMLNAVRGGLMSFREILDLPTRIEKQRNMLDRCEEVYELAKTRTRPMKNGEMVDPDAHSMLKATELACTIIGLDTKEPAEEAEQREISIQRVIGLIESAGYEVKKRAA